MPNLDQEENKATNNVLECEKLNDWEREREDSESSEDEEEESGSEWEGAGSSAAELERACLEALSEHKVRRARHILDALARAFPADSARLLRLRASHALCSGRVGHALRLLARCPETEAGTCGGRVAAALWGGAAGRSTAVARALHAAGLWQRDPAPWLALHALYLAAGQPERAAFCLEELVLHAPHSHLYHTQLAAARYTQRPQDLTAAAAHYAHALRLNPGSARAALGLALCGSGGGRDPGWAAQRVAAIYGSAEGAAPLPLPAPASVAACALPLLLDSLAINK